MNFSDELKFSTNLTESWYEMNNGIKHGRYIKIESGFITIFGFYRNNLQHGIWKYWDIDGYLIREGYFNNGLQEGLWKYWDNEKKK